MDNVKTFIDSNLAAIRSPRDVALGLGLNYETLRKSFRYGEMITLGRYITLRRIEAAKRLLIEKPDLYCYQVCDEVGFSSEAQGEKYFHSFTGLTMREYRQQYLDQ